MVLAALTGLAAALLAWLNPSTPRLALGATPDSWAQTPDGPVGPDDRALLVALRQDALWEVPTAEQAQQMATDPALRQAGGAVATDLGWLGGQVRAVADRLHVTLPSQPTPDQQSWMVDIAATSGHDYDRALITRLRAACAATLDRLVQADATTRNEALRRLVGQATGVVTRHLATLDTLAGAAAATPSGSGPGPLLVGALLVLLAGAAVVGWVARQGGPVWALPSSGRALLWHGPAGWHGPAARRIGPTGPGGSSGRRGARGTGGDDDPSDLADEFGPAGWADEDRSTTWTGSAPHGGFGTGSRPGLVERSGPISRSGSLETHDPTRWTRRRRRPVELPPPVRLVPRGDRRPW